jgi:hypothetical protein
MRKSKKTTHIVERQTKPWPVMPSQAVEMEKHGFLDGRNIHKEFFGRHHH